MGGSQKRQKAAIEKALRKYLGSFGSASPALKEAMKYAVFSGGKRIRPILVLESCRACGGSIAKAMPAACAIELIHNFSLVHDDLPSMDDDDYRRGKPACHKKFGEALALLTGDALLNLAYGILAGMKDRRVSQEVSKELSGATGSNGMIGGQVLDIGCGARKNLKMRQALVNRLKTASLFGAALKSGAIVSGASADKIMKMRRFGIGFGLAFQSVDDIIDGKYLKGPVLEAEKEKAKKKYTIGEG